MLATARLTGQTIGATLVAILFHASTRGATLALVMGAAFAAAGAAASFSRLEKSAGAARDPQAPTIHGGA